MQHLQTMEVLFHLTHFPHKSAAQLNACTTELADGRSESSKFRYHPDSMCSIAADCLSPADSLIFQQLL